MCFRFAFLVVLIFVGTIPSIAIPQFSAYSGNRCSDCHVAPSGGGLRNDLGWYSWYDVGLVSREAGFLKWLYGSDTVNRFGEGTFLWGVDARLQSTRGFTPGSERRIIPMQASIYAALTPTSAITIEGSLNLASFRAGGLVYPGQRLGHLSALFQPHNLWPMLRAGLFRPSVGMRYDDHTLSSYSYTTGSIRRTYLAPDWSEYGLEATYEGLSWLTAQAGIFGSEGLSQLRVEGLHVIDGSSPTLTGRVVFWPKFLTGKFNAWLGGSILNNGDFNIQSMFASLGWNDNLAVMFDHTATSKPNVVTSRNTSLQISWQALDAFHPFGRYEVYESTLGTSSKLHHSNAAVLGAMIFALPQLELRPEYRIWDTRLDGTSNRWNLQLHFFY